MNQKHRYLFLVFFFTLLVFADACKVTRQAQYASNLAKCDFRIRSVEDVNIAGVQFENVQSVSDLGITDIARVIGSFTSPTVPLSLQLNLEVRNPNQQPAGLNRIDWILFIDDIQMTTGILDEPFMIPASSLAMVPVSVAIDLKAVLKGKSADALMNFCLNLAGMGNVPTRFKIRLKPTIYVGKTAMTYPGYITVKTSYSAN